MGLHVAQIGVGRVGRPTVHNIMCTGRINKLTVCDTKSGLAKAFSEELNHVVASLELDLEIIWCEKDEDVEGADIILISAGEPRVSGVQLSRRDLVNKNTRIIKEIAEKTAPNNLQAKYLVITNPVDVMAMLFKRFSGADFVLGTGTNLETLRFRSKLARVLGLHPAKISGWVGGEHGDAAVFLWSTVKVDNTPLDDYVKESNFNKTEVETYVKEVSRMIIDNIGGTEYGPAASFRDLVMAIVEDQKKIFPISTPLRWIKIPEPVFVSVPLVLGKSIGPSLFERLTKIEKKELENAAKCIYDNYRTALAFIAGMEQ